MEDEFVVVDVPVAVPVVLVVAGLVFVIAASDKTDAGEVGEVDEAEGSGGFGDGTDAMSFFAIA